MKKEKLLNTLSVKRDLEHQIEENNRKKVKKKIHLNKQTKAFNQLN